MGVVLPHDGLESKKLQNDHFEIKQYHVFKGLFLF